MKLLAAKNGGAKNSAVVVPFETTIPVPAIVAVIGVLVAAIGLAVVLLRRR